MLIKAVKVIGHIGLILLLTLITQIGGVIYVLSSLISRGWKRRRRFKMTLLFFGLYFTATLLVVPFIAPLFGREKVKHTSNISATNYMTIVLNRNYVKPELNNLLREVSEDLIKQDSNIVISYLDANFPFINGFPLLPHLSHNDGKKIDLSLMYISENGELSNLKKSISGYGVFVNSNQDEFNQTNFCKENGYFQYDFPKYLTFGQINKELVFSEKDTKSLVNCILKKSKLGKLFIEPHLKSRLKLNHPKVRFHGCGAVRHDDHIHIQL